MAVTLSLSLHANQISAQANPIDVKFRYVKLLSSLVRNTQEGEMLCLFVEDQYNNVIEDATPNISIYGNLNDTGNCKTAYLSRGSDITLEDFAAHFKNTSTLTITDADKSCEYDFAVKLFQKGKRIFFSVNQTVLTEKSISLSSQVLALSKPSRCDGK